MIALSARNSQTLSSISNIYDSYRNMDDSACVDNCAPSLFQNHMTQQNCIYHELRGLSVTLKLLYTLVIGGDTVQQAFLLL